MASVFDLFGVNAKQNETLLPELGIKNSVNALQVTSERFFKIRPEAAARDGNFLAVTVEKDQKFELSSSAHINFLRDAVKLFKDKSEELKAVDQKIVYSTLLGVVASTLSFFPFVGYFSALGWGSALYHVAQRSKAYDEYQESLKLLVGTCNWSLGESSDDKTALTKNPDIRDMMATLYPVLTETQARHLLADDIEEVFASELRNYESKYQLSSATASFFHGDESIARSKRSAEFSRCIYGFNKGGVSDYLDAAFSIFPDIYNAVDHGIKRLQYWWNKDTRDAQATEQNASASM